MCIAIPIEVIKKIITSLTRPLGHPLWLCLRGFIFSCGYPIAISYYPSFAAQGKEYPSATSSSSAYS